MVLESLLELVETLRKRIDEHGAALRQSEALTRAALIDPLLRELGWDTENPALVIPEYRSSAGSADYALISDSSQPPVLIIEAKKLGESLDDRVALQSLNYCNLIGTPHFALTDGKTWKIYSTFEQAPLADRLIATFSIGEMTAAEVCLRALALWRPSIIGGKVSVGRAPIFEAESATQRSIPEASVQEAATPTQPIVINPSKHEEFNLNQNLSVTAKLREASVYVLRRDGPLPFSDVCDGVENLAPDLCQEGSGRDWRHDVANALQVLKRQEIVFLENSLWQLV